MPLDNNCTPECIINKMITNFESYFEENSIYKTLFICGFDEEVYDILTKLENNNHSVSVLFYDEIYDERDYFYNKLIDFRTINHRIFLISYQTWYMIDSELKVFILPYQNLIAFGDISDDGIKNINNWLYNARLTGFLNEEPRLLNLLSDD